MAWVLAPTNVLLLHFEDDAGKHATMKFNLANTETNPSGGGASAISNAAAAISDSALYETEILIIAIEDDPDDPTTGAYDRPADKMLIKLKAQDGSYSTIQIGAPLETNFSNAYDVDFTATDIEAFLTAMFENANTAGGAIFAAATEGFRRQPPRRKSI